MCTYVGEDSLLRVLHAEELTLDESFQTSISVVQH